MTTPARSRFSDAVARAWTAAVSLIILVAAVVGVAAIRGIGKWLILQGVVALALAYGTYYFGKFRSSADGRQTIDAAPPGDPLTNPNEGGITQELTRCGLANAFRIPLDNAARENRVRELINDEVDSGRNVRLAASSGFSYLNPNGHVWREARLGQLIVSGVMNMVAVLESPFSDFALTRALANGVDHHHWQEKQTPENLVNLLQYPNVTIRVTDRAVNCSLFLTSQAIYYDPYLWALPHPGARTENNFFVLEFTRITDRDRDCYALLEKHFQFLLSHSVPLEEVLHEPVGGSPCPLGKEFFDLFLNRREVALNRYRALTSEFTERARSLKKDHDGLLRA